MARRRRRKEPSGAEVIITAIAGAFGLAFLNGISPSQILGYVIWAIAIIIFFAITVWFIRGLIYSSGPNGSKRNQSSAARRAQLSYHRHPEKQSVEGSFTSAGPTPNKWSKELIADLEWRVFEKLCTKLWEAKGFLARETEPGADGGVDLYLYAKSTNRKIGAVQCKSWKSKQIGVNVLRELQGVIAAENLKLGLLMYSGGLSDAARDFLKNPSVTVKAQSAEDIYAEISKLNESDQQALLNQTLLDEYAVPSCPNCDIKLVERTAKRTGNVFWGCENFPRCRYTMR